MSEIYRTPDERFVGLPGFDFAAQYVGGLAGYEGLRMHYLDEGSKDAEHVFLCLHGEPSWCYLYRNMIPVFTEFGGRAVAPDFFGFGRSDKPVAKETYTFDFHREAMRRFIEHLDLQRITLVCQDWGGLIGLTLPMEYPERFDRLIIMNTTFPTGRMGKKGNPGFQAWQDWVKSLDFMKVDELFGRTEPGLSAEERAAYAAPYPVPEAQGGVLTFPLIVPTTPEMDGAETGVRAVKWFAENWAPRPSFMGVGLNDPVFSFAAMQKIRSLIPGCPAPLGIEDAGHFVQDRGGERIARAALEHFASP